MISILKHISFARDWLDKAEEKIRYGSLLDGELYLSLAEAEVRKAWEGSVSHRKQEEVMDKRKKSLPFLVVSVLALGLVFFAVSHLYTPPVLTESIELQLTDGYRERTAIQEENNFRLINVDLMMLDNNIDRRNLN